MYHVQLSIKYVQVDWRVWFMGQWVSS